VLAFAALTALSVVPRAYGLKQVLVGFWPFATFVAAWSLTSLPTPTARPGASDPTGGGRGAAVLVALSSVALLVTFLTPKADWRGVARHLEASRDPVRPVVVLDPGYNQLPFGYYLPSYPVIAGPVVSLEPLAAAARDRRDVCLVAERFGKPTPTSPTEAWFDAHLRLTRSRPFARLELRCYRVP
jgi:hypothetical protein